MSLGQCSCPECGTTLRVRDRSFVGRVIECPDCRVKLTITLDDARTLVAERAKAEPVPKSSPRLESSVARFGSALRDKISGIAQSPLALAWALAIGLTAFAAILMLRPAVRFRTPTSTGEQSPSLAVTTPADGQSSPENNPVTDATEPRPPESPSQTDANPGQTPNEPVAGTTVPEITPAPIPSVPPEVTPTDKPNTVAIVPAVNPDTNLKPVPVAVKIDVDALLKQRFQKIETNRPQSRLQMIELVEELLGAPIRYDRDELGEKNLERTITINLETTTLGGVLKVIVESAGWEYVVEDNGLRLKPRRVADTPGP